MAPWYSNRLMCSLFIPKFTKSTETPDITISTRPVHPLFCGGLALPADFPVGGGSRDPQKVRHEAALRLRSTWGSGQGVGGRAGHGAFRARALSSASMVTAEAQLALWRSYIARRRLLPKTSATQSSCGLLQMLSDSFHYG